MIVTFLLHRIDDAGCDPVAVGDPLFRLWPGDVGPALGDRIAPLIDDLGWLVVRERRWVPTVSGWELTVVVHGRRAEVKS